MTSTSGNQASDPNRLDIDTLARRAVEGFLRFVTRLTRLGIWLLAFAVVVCGVGFALGYMATSGSGRTFWIILGGGFAVFCIGAIGLALWRLWLIKHAGAALIGDVRQMLSTDPAAQRVVIETVETSERSTSTAIVASSNGYGQWREVVAKQPGQFVAIGVALAALAAVPKLIGMAIVVMLSFMGLSMLFLAAIVLG